MYKYVIRPLILGLLVGYIISCSSARITREQNSPELQVYRDELKRISNNELGADYVLLRFGKDKKFGKKTVATCTQNPFIMTYEVDINKDMWYSFTYKEKMLILAHEFKHCQCQSEHIDTTKNGCFTDFMASKMDDLACTEKMWDKYLEDMQNGCT